MMNYKNKSHDHAHGMHKDAHKCSGKMTWTGKGDHKMDSHMDPHWNGKELPGVKRHLHGNLKNK